MVIVGAGECGARAALTLREQGYGGPLDLIGEEAHLPYERPPLSKGAMIDEGEPIVKAVAGERLTEADVELVMGTRQLARPRGQDGGLLTGAASTTTNSCLRQGHHPDVSCG